MLRSEAISVNLENNYFITAEFDSGEIKRFDVKTYIKGSCYGQLEDLKYINRVTIDGNTVCWPEG